MTARLREAYNNDVFKALKEKFDYKNPMEVPKLVKVTINMGLGEAKENAKILDSAVKELAVISGQRPVKTKARKSIANFKVREGMPVGCKVTLRKKQQHCYHFLECRLRNRRRRWLKNLSRLNSRENLNFQHVHIPDAKSVEGRTPY